MTTHRSLHATLVLALLPLFSACSGLPAADPVAAPLAGTAWQVLAFDRGQQALAGMLDGTSMTLAFGADGRLSGSAGCNRYGGQYTQAGERLSLGPLVSTRKGCAAPEGLMAQESAFLRALETVTLARREGGRLELRSAAGAPVVSLAPAR